MKRALLFRQLGATLLLTMTAASGAQAGTAEVSAGEGGSVTYEYSDTSMRLNMPGQSSYMLLRGDKVYMVTNQAGVPMVIDANQAFGMAGGMTAGAATPDTLNQQVVSIKATGKLEQQAGISGEIYLVRTKNGSGKEVEHEVVLSEDPRALEFRDAMFHMGSVMAKVMKQPNAETSNNHMLAELVKINKGILRYGNDMKIVSLSSDPVEPARFELPAAPMDMSGLGGILGQMRGDAPKR